jgi:hypothetical protein
MARINALPTVGGNLPATIGELWENSVSWCKSCKFAYPNFQDNCPICNALLGLVDTRVTEGCVCGRLKPVGSKCVHSIDSSSSSRKPKKKLSSVINHPAHYNELNAVCKECDHPIECIDVVREMVFNLGNAIKYIWRCDLKGNPIENLKKAIWYLNDEIKRRDP